MLGDFSLINLLGFSFQIFTYLKIFFTKPENTLFDIYSFMFVRIYVKKNFNSKIKAIKLAI